MSADGVIGLGDIDSTNAFAIRSFEELSDGVLVIANRQTAGRGRRGRRWLSPEGGLYATYVCKLSGVSPVLAGGAAGLGTLETLLARAPDTRWGVKWPNDVCASRDGVLFKIAGILVETVSAAGDGFVVGIGLNVNTSKHDLLGCDIPTTSLFLETGGRFDLMSVAVELRENICEWRTVALESPEKLHEQWKKRNVLLGRRVCALFENGRSVDGIATDIADSGELLIRLDDGVEERVSSGDVSLRPY